MTRWQTLTILGYAVVSILFLDDGLAAAKELAARGDADCSISFSASDMVASVRGFGGDSVCDNDDCDRDGALAPADVDCAARCLFGECPIPPHAPSVTVVEPEASPAISPFTTVVVRGSGFTLDNTVTRVTIGGVRAEVVEVISPEEIAVLVPSLPPGPAPLRVQAGELVGRAVLIDIAAQAPVGLADSFVGTLELLAEALGLFAQLDLGEAFGEDAEAVREAIQVYRDEIAAQRLAMADALDFTAELESTLDAGMDSAGVPEELRELIADIRTLLASEEVDAMRGKRAGAAVGSGTVARRVARTLAVARGVIQAGGTAIATGASVPTSLIAVGASVLAGALTLGGSAALPPLIVETVFLDSGLQRTDKIHVYGAIRVRGHRLVDTQLVVRTAMGEITFPPTIVGDDFRQFRLLPYVGFCGFVDFYLKREFLAGTSAPVRWGVQPELSTFAPERVEAGAELSLFSEGVSGCRAYARYTRAGQFRFDGEDVKARQSNLVTTRVPNIPTDEYAVDVSVDGLISNKLPGLQVFNPISGVQVTCVALGLNLEPDTPTATTCTAKPIPATAALPAGSRWVWATSNAWTAAIEGEGPQIRVVAIQPGSTAISAQLKLNDEVLADTTSAVTITVRDISAPSGILRHAGSGQVTAGSAVSLTVHAIDNDVVRRVVLRATGDAAVNPTQEFACPHLGEDCDAEFTVNLKESGFTSSEVMIVADIFDGAGNRGTSNELVLNITEDTTCPSLTITSPANGSTVNAGRTVQVLANAADEQGVKTFRYTATGDALASPVAQELTFPMALPAPELRFNFTVKSADDLRDVTDRTIVATVEAFDAKGNTCGARSISLTVIGVLDQCQGSISVDNPVGYTGDAVTITVTITGEVAAEIVNVTSVNPAGIFDLFPRGNGVYDVTLFYRGRGAYTLTFYAADGNGVTRCSGSIGLESLGQRP